VTGLPIAEHHFMARHYVQARKLLSQLLFPKPMIRGAEDIARAHVLLAACHLALGNRNDTQSIIRSIVAKDIVLPAKIKKALLSRNSAAQAPQKATTPKEATNEISPHWSAKEIGFHLLPFGMGQMYDDRYAAGAAYLVVQTALGALAFAHRTELSRVLGAATNEGGGAFTCPLDDVEQCNAARTNSNVFSLLFAVSVAVGIADAFLLRPANAPSMTKSEAQTSLHLAPMADGFSAGITWDY
jgi:hypothetical protein